MEYLKIFTRRSARGDRRPGAPDQRRRHTCAPRSGPWPTTSPTWCTRRRNGRAAAAAAAAIFGGDDLPALTEATLRAVVAELG